MGQGVIDGIEIRAIRAEDLAAYKALRLEALRSHPEAYGSDYSEQVNEPDSFWEGRIRSSVEGDASRIVVAADAGGGLAGMAGVFRDGGVKLRHSAVLVAVYVAPRWRGRRLADAMVGEAVAWCAGVGVRIVRLAVATGNVPAIRCYQRCGFQVCGVQSEVIRVGDTYHDELMMWRRV
jgi:RimJ/RimL family protein N-acetyltransferase